MRVSSHININHTEGSGHWNRRQRDFSWEEEEEEETKTQEGALQNAPCSLDCNGLGWFYVSCSAMLQLVSWGLGKFHLKGSPHRCRHGLDPHHICVFCLHVVTEHRGARCQMHHPQPFLLISAPLRAALWAEASSSKPGNMCGLVHMSLQTFHHRKLLSILKEIFLSELI